MAHLATPAAQPRHKDLPAAARRPDMPPVTRPEHQRPGARRAVRTGELHVTPGRHISTGRQRARPYDGHGRLTASDPSPRSAQNEARRDPSRSRGRQNLGLLGAQRRQQSSKSMAGHQVGLALAGRSAARRRRAGRGSRPCGPGIQRQQRNRPAPGARPRLNGAQVAQLRPRVQGPRRVSRRHLVMTVHAHALGLLLGLAFTELALVVAEVLLTARRDRELGARVSFCED